MHITKIENNPLYREEDYQRRKTQVIGHSVDMRDPFEKDYGKIIHSASFRRLQSKTQVIGLEAGDFHRTRLTHSMEVAQIARGIVIVLNKHQPFTEGEYAHINISLVEAAALAHDLGHPPFGHRGEEILHEIMRPYGGFEGNAHTFRILTRLEGERNVGLNITRALLLAITKYPIQFDEAINGTFTALPPKTSIFADDEDAFFWTCQGFTEQEKEYFLQREILEDYTKRSVNKTLECSIIEMADDIAYGTHDVEDAIHLNFISIVQLQELLGSFLSSKCYPELTLAYQLLERCSYYDSNFKVKLKKVFSYLISTFIGSLEVEVRVEHPKFNPRLKYEVKLPLELHSLLEKLKKLVIIQVIESQEVQTVAWKGRRVIKKIFAAMMDESKLLPEKDRLMFLQAETETSKARVICDYIAGMTDSFALKTYTKLFG